MLETNRFWKFTAIALMVMNTVLIGVFIFMFINRPDTRMKPRFNPDPNDPVFQIGSRLDLSRDQKESLRDSSLLKQRESAKYELMKLRGALLRESRAENPDTELVDSLIRQIANQHAVMERETFKGIRKLREISTPKQRERFNKMIDKLEKGSEMRRRTKQRKRQDSSN